MTVPNHLTHYAVITVNPENNIDKTKLSKNAGSYKTELISIRLNERSY